MAARWQIARPAGHTFSAGPIWLITVDQYRLSHVLVRVATDTDIDATSRDFLLSLHNHTLINIPLRLGGHYRVRGDAADFKLSITPRTTS